MGVDSSFLLWAPVLRHILPTLDACKFSFFVYCFSPGQKRGTLRLSVSQHGTSFSSYYYGQLQIYWDGGWNNICDDESFSIDEGEVACHQLGYSGLSYITTRYHCAVKLNKLLYTTITSGLIKYNN